MFNFMYKISAFGEFFDIGTTPDNMLFLLESFKKYNMIPSIFTETIMDINLQQPSAPLTHKPLQRFSLISTDNQEKILIYSNRLDYEISASVDKKLDNLENYTEKILSSFGIILNHYNKKAIRLAFNLSSLIADINKTTLKNIIDNLSPATNPIKIYNKDILDEWGTYLMTRKDINICDESEKINIITNITKAKIAKPEFGILLSDGFQVTIDINTIPENNDPRFNADSFNDFIVEANKINNDIYTDIGKLSCE